MSIITKTQRGLSVIPLNAPTFWFHKDDVDDSLLLMDPDIIHLATPITRTLKVVQKNVITQRKIFINCHLHRPACLLLLLCQNMIQPCDRFCPVQVSRFPSMTVITCTNLAHCPNMFLIQAQLSQHSNLSLFVCLLVCQI